LNYSTLRGKKAQKLGKEEAQAGEKGKKDPQEE
jgi:hypothetical protein